MVAKINTFVAKNIVLSGNYNGNAVAEIIATMVHRVTGFKPLALLRLPNKI